MRISSVGSHLEVKVVFPHTVSFEELREKRIIKQLCFVWVAKYVKYQNSVWMLVSILAYFTFFSL